MVYFYAVAIKRYHSIKSVHNVALLNDLVFFSTTGVKDRRCFTPLHCASQSGNVDVVIALLEGGAEPNCRGFAGATPLHISVNITSHKLSLLNETLRLNMPVYRF